MELKRLNKKIKIFLHFHGISPSKQNQNKLKTGALRDVDVITRNQENLSRRLLIGSKS